MLTDEKFMRKVLPFIKPDYFEGAYRTIFREAGKYVAKYNSLPVHEAFKIELDNSDSLSNEQYKVAVEVLPNLFQDDGTDSRWLDDATEKWCQDRALHNAVMESIQIIDGKHDTLTKNALPDILQKALGVAFDLKVGHDYIENSEERYEFYHRDEERIPLTWNTSIKSRRVEYPIRLSTLLLLALVWVSHFLCVTVPQLIYAQVRMFFTSPWKWLKNESLNVLMLIFLMYLLIS
jgi:hypothetical protein